MAEIHMLASNRYEWVLEGDIKACFDEIDHRALLGRVRARVGDKRVVALVKAFLWAGALSEDGVTRDTKMGTPDGGVRGRKMAHQMAHSQTFGEGRRRTHGTVASRNPVASRSSYPDATAVRLLAHLAARRG